jgi:hypothetical protein
VEAAGIGLEGHELHPGRAGGGLNLGVNVNAAARVECARASRVDTRWCGSSAAA